jgi:hypothetical protein
MDSFMTEGYKNLQIRVKVMAGAHDLA